MRDSLHQHGVSFHLGHGGCPCKSPTTTKLMTIADTNGFHHVSTQFCGCSVVVEERLEFRQLLAAGLFPATTESPCTAFTFIVLDSLAALTSRGKTSTYDYHEALRVLTDNCGLNGFTVSHRALYSCIPFLYHL
jgi:hypothetical protein